MSDDERLTPEQGLVAMAARSGTEIAAEVRDPVLAARIMRQVAAAFDEGLRRGEAARAARDVEPEPERGTLVGTVRAIRPAEIRARRWAE